ncbi:putative isochorismatase family protein YecD [Acidithiobacillus thiooxidans ATCC 19377]|uniref:Putative isochorismatase family protein YecD n=2 Tax=Acidithiobacillus thiooxidans TaxID=930 RepID=A0A543Q018_ACITH|nr:putative isochorismatase family protein YecD [Acidithiobacillus thiooxidans ATCC 19377]
MKSRQLHLWKNRHLSFYYEGFDIPDLDIELDNMCLLVIDIQNTQYFSKKNSEQVGNKQNRWSPFINRMNSTVIPNTKKIINYLRLKNVPIIFARVGFLTTDGSDRSLSQKRTGFNQTKLNANEFQSQVLNELEPSKNDIILTKSCDSAVIGTNLRLILNNMGIKTVIVCGIYTDQCVSSTVRDLADESFNVILIEDACAAGTDEIHNHELMVINNIYCQVLNLQELIKILSNLSK